LRREVIGNCHLYLGDCLEIVPQLNFAGAIVSDPPYGMDWDTDHSRFKPGPNGHVSRGVAWRAKIEGDAKPFDPVPWVVTFDEVILWGSNHFGQKLPVGTTLVWLKRLDPAFGSFLSDDECRGQGSGPPYAKACRSYELVHRTA
jgi:site-specific DNA-methyltransferase (adenine-specific)